MVRRFITGTVFILSLIAGIPAMPAAQVPPEAPGFAGDGLHLYPLGWSSEGRWGALIGRDGPAGGIRILVIDAVTDEVLHRSENLQWSGREGFAAFWSLYGARIQGVVDSFGLESTLRPDVRDARFITDGVSYEFVMDPPSPAAGAYVLRLRSSRGDSKEVHRSIPADAPERAILAGVMVSPFEARAVAIIRETSAVAAGRPGEAGYRFSGAHLTLGFASTASRPTATPLPPAAGTGSIVNAVFNGQEYLLRARLASGGDPDEKDGRGYTALLLAARLRHWLMLADLLSAGASPNPRDSDGRTPLHHAAFAGNEAAVRALLNAGADRGIADQGGLRPSDLAADGTIKALLR